MSEKERGKKRKRERVRERDEKIIKWSKCCLPKLSKMFFHFSISRFCFEKVASNRKKPGSKTNRKTLFKHLETIFVFDLELVNCLRSNARTLVRTITLIL